MSDILDAIGLAGTRLDLPRLLNDAMLGPEGSAAVSFNLEASVAKRNAGGQIVLAFLKEGKTLSCVFFSDTDARR
jgi:hypothetical protein